MYKNMPSLRNTSPHNSESFYSNQEESSGIGIAKFMANIRTVGHRSSGKEGMRLISTAFIGIMFGFLIGNLLPSFSIFKINISSTLLCSENKSLCAKPPTIQGGGVSSTNSSEIYVPTNPRGAERLPSGIVVSQSDYYLHRLWGEPSEDLPIQQKYLVAFTVGFDQRDNIDAAVKKFSENFTIVLFHYDGRTSEWNNYEWSNRTIHVSAQKQTKWWYAKRFLHPDVVAPYDYIFIWDEDIGVKNFNGEKYVEMIKKYGLDISQPGVESETYVQWEMTKRRNDTEVHKETEEMERRCKEQYQCDIFVEIMAPVFSRNAWRCVWHMIQNDLVHGWGLDNEFRKCALPNREKMGVVDTQWIVHQHLPTLGKQGQAGKGKTPWQMVRERCLNEWEIFRNRMQNATRAYYEHLTITHI